MIPSFKKQAINSYKNTDVIHPDGDRLFLGFFDGYVREFSMISKTTVHEQKIFTFHISSMTKTPDNKSQFVCCVSGGFVELDIPTRKQANSFNVKNTRVCVVTHDNKFLITTENKIRPNLTKWSIRSKKQLHTWKSDADMIVYSQSVSYDNKYQLIGYDSGLLGIFDLQRHQTLKIMKVMINDIHLITISRDNQSAYISDRTTFKMIKWQAGANSRDISDFTQKIKKYLHLVIIQYVLQKTRNTYLLDQLNHCLYLKQRQEK